MTQWQKILAILAFAAAARHVFVAPANQPLQPPNVVTHVVQRPEFPPVGQDAELYPAELYSVEISVPAGKAVLLTSLSVAGSRQPVVLTWRECDDQSEFDSHSLTDHDLPPGWLAPVLRDLPRAARRTADAVANPEWEHIQDAVDHADSAAAVNSLLPANPRQRRFVVPFFTGQLAHDRHVLATEIAKGKRVSVYLVDGDAAAFAPRDLATNDFNANLPVASVMHAQQAATELAAQIITRCEQRLLPFVERQLGAIHDLDDDGSLTFVLAQLSVNGPDHAIEPPITGCVRPSDFMWNTFRNADSSATDWADLAHGGDLDNGGDIVYLDCLLPGGREMDAVLAHELAHAATFCLLNESVSADGELPGWLNEAIAHAIEQQVHPDSQNLAQRLTEFTARPHLFPIVIPDGSTHLSLRRGPARAAGCLFLNAVLQDLPDQSLRRIVQAGRSGVERLEQIAGRPFAELLRDWGLQRMAGSVPYPELQLNSQHPVQLQLAGTAIAWTGAAPADGVLQIQAPTAARLQITIVNQTSFRNLEP